MTNVEQVASQPPQIDFEAANLRCLSVASINAGRVAARNALVTELGGGEQEFLFGEDQNMVQAGGVESSMHAPGARLLAILSQVAPEYVPRDTLIGVMTKQFGLGKASVTQAISQAYKELNTVADDEFIQVRSELGGRRRSLRIHPSYVVRPLTAELPEIKGYDDGDMQFTIDTVVVANVLRRPPSRVVPRGKIVRRYAPQKLQYKTPGPDDTITGENWREFRACANVDPTLFFPSDGVGVDEAKKVCAACPVQGHCLEYALSTGQDNGVWGGASERERRRILKARATRRT